MLTGVQQIGLSPSNELFSIYLKLKNNFKWHEPTFQSIYVPKFLSEIKKNKKAIQLLNELYLKSKNGEIIFLGCFCNNEYLCHRSIIAGLLLGVGVEVISTTTKDCSIYKKYYDMYLQIA